MPGYRKLGRTSAHRKAMLRNLVTDLLREGRITTTDTLSLIHISEPTRP